MIVYVESNFILELAFQQEEHESCLTLLDLAASKEIDLVLPAFSIGETYEVWVRRSKRRLVTLDTLKIEMNEFSRSKRYQKTITQFEELKELLPNSNAEEKEELDKTLGTILNRVEMVPISLNVMGAAIAFQETHKLSPQDSIVYASIIDHLTSVSPSTSCFITKNSKDFLKTQIENELSNHHCRLFTKFSNALGYIFHQA